MDQETYLKFQQDQEFERAKLLDSLQSLHQIIEKDNKQKEKLIQLYESQNDLVNNIKGQNKYNNPRLNAKYELENTKLIEIKEKLDICMENNNKLQEKLENLQNEITNLE